MTRTPLALAMLVTLALAGCGSGTNGSPDAGSTGSQTSDQNDGVPDPCSLMSSQQLGELLGVDPGAGDSVSISSDRAICTYSNGIITAVEIAANYETSRELIEDNGSTTSDIDGLGTAAFYDSNGQVVAKGDRYFVAVTASVPKENLIAATRELLAAAESAQ